MARIRALHILTAMIAINGLGSNSGYESLNYQHLSSADRRRQSIPEGAEENLQRGFSLSSEIEAAETPKEEEREEEVRP